MSWVMRALIGGLLAGLVIPPWMLRDCCCTRQAAQASVAGESTSLPPCCAARLKAGRLQGTPARTTRASHQVAELASRHPCRCATTIATAVPARVVRAADSLSLPANPFATIAASADQLFVETSNDQFQVSRAPPLVRQRLTLLCRSLT